MVGVLAAVLVLALWWTVSAQADAARRRRRCKADTDSRAAEARRRSRRSSPRRSATPRTRRSSRRSSTSLAAGDARLAGARRVPPRRQRHRVGVGRRVAVGDARAADARRRRCRVDHASASRSRAPTTRSSTTSTRLAALKRLVVVDSVQLVDRRQRRGAATGDARRARGGSTGPFSGASQLTATISARMFESPAHRLRARRDRVRRPASTGHGAPPATGATRRTTADADITRSTAVQHRLAESASGYAAVDP